MNLRYFFILRFTVRACKPSCSSPQPCHPRRYLFLPQIVYDDEENENYAALIIRKDNPNFMELVSEFTDTINLLNGKPD